MAITPAGQGKWLVRVSIRDDNGRSIIKQKTVEGTRSDAAVVYADIYRELEARGSLTSHVSTFADAVDVYLEKIRLCGRCSDDHADMVGYVRRRLGHIRLEVFAEHFAPWWKRLTSTPTAFGKARGSASVNRYTAIVRAVFGVLVEREIIDRNPITKARFPTLREKPRDRYPTPEERLRLLTAIKEYRPWLLPIIAYMMAVPCRSGEMVSATREMYNPFTGMIHVPDSKARVPIIKPVPPEMVDYFRNIPKDCPWLFYQETSPGKYRQVNHYRKAWEYCCKVAGISDFHVHDLRHVAVTDLIAVGNTDHVVADVAGWKSTAMLNVYRHKSGIRSAQQLDFGRSPPPDVGELTKGAM